MRARSLRVAVAAAAAALAVTALAAPAIGANATAKAPRVVVAVADTGVNPYHKIYYRPANTAHPCTWVEGFSDCDLPALELSVGRYDSIEQALATDQEVWDSVVPHQWYWIPRTNIIGAVCEKPASSPTDLGEQRCILDDDGQGTATSSAVLMENPHALLLIHEGDAGAADMATAPVVPDIQSHSWSSPAPLPLHPVGVATGADVCTTPPFHPETLVFLAAGNEAPLPTFADCAKAWPDVQVVGGGFPGHWETGSWSAFDFASWMCRPVAVHTAIEGQLPDQCGTSVAAPTVAGAASRALLEARRAQGYVGGSTATTVSTDVTRDGFVQALRRGAIYDVRQREYNNQPRPGLSQPLPQQAPWLFWGYGWIDGTQIDEITRCALGQFCLPLEPQAEQWNSTRRTIREEST